VGVGVGLEAYQPIGCMSVGDGGRCSCALYSAVQCSVVLDHLRSEGQCCAVQCSVSVIRSHQVQQNSLQYSVQCSTIQCSAVLYLITSLLTPVALSIPHNFVISFFFSKHFIS